MATLFVRAVIQEPVGSLITTDTLPVSFHWQLLNGDVVQAGKSTPEEFSILGEKYTHWPDSPADIVGIIPGDEVLLLGCEVPGRTAATIKKALPFVLEEFVAGEIESLHIAHGKIKPGQPVQNALISKQRLMQWQACFSGIGVRPGVIVSESQLLTTDTKACTLVFIDSEVLIVTEDESASVARSELIGFLLNMDLEKVICVEGQLTDIEVSQLDAGLKVENVKQHHFDYLLSRFEKSAQINLLQGEFKVVASSSEPTKAVAGIAGMLCIWFVVAIVSFAVEGYWAESRADMLEEQTSSLYAEYFPEDSVPVTTGQLSRRLKAKLGTASDTEDNPQGFVDLLSRVSAGFTGADKIQSLRFSRRRMQLTFEILLPGFNELDPLKERSAEQGVIINVTNADNDGTSVRARLSAEYQ